MKKLQLKKDVVATMSKENMENVKGGWITGIVFDCVTIAYPTLDIKCKTVQDCIALQQNTEVTC